MQPRPHGFRAALERSRLAAKDKTLPRVLDDDSLSAYSEHVLLGVLVFNALFPLDAISGRKLLSSNPRLLRSPPTGGDVSTLPPDAVGSVALRMLALTRNGGMPRRCTEATELGWGEVRYCFS